MLLVFLRFNFIKAIAGQKFNQTTINAKKIAHCTCVHTIYDRQQRFRLRSILSWIDSRTSMMFIHFYLLCSFLSVRYSLFCFFSLLMFFSIMLCVYDFFFLSPMSPTLLSKYFSTPDTCHIFPRYICSTFAHEWKLQTFRLLLYRIVFGSDPSEYCVQTQQ